MLVNVRPVLVKLRPMLVKEGTHLGKVRLKLVIVGREIVKLRPILVEI